MRLLSATLCLLGLVGQAQADCDAAVLSAIDSSVSIDRGELAVEVQGMAYAIRSPELLSTIQRGRRGCITMAAYVWATTTPVVVLPWTTIASKEDAEAAAASLLTIAESLNDNPAGVATNTASALQFAYQMFAATNVMTERQVLNLITDDSPNDHPEEVPAARAALLAAGAQINGVSVTSDPSVTDYLSTQIIGGRGAFVMVIGEAENMAAAMVSKFHLDLASAQ